jgi:hypothetical protein
VAQNKTKKTTANHRQCEKIPAKVKDKQHGSHQKSGLTQLF